MNLRKYGAVLCIAILCGCSAGGVASHALPLPSAPATSGGGSGKQRGSLRFRIAVPEKNRQQPARRRPQYISVSTQSLTIAIDGGSPAAYNLTPSSSNCTAGSGQTALTCTILQATSSGNHIVTVMTYDLPGGSGNVLSQNTISTIVAPGQVNTIPITLNGVVASLSLALANNTLAQGSPATVGLSVNAYDADQNLIIGPGAYQSNVIVNDTDKSGGTTLSVTDNGTTSNEGASATVLDPSASISVNYDGQPLAPATFSAVSGQIMTTQSQNAVLTFPGADWSTMGYDLQRTGYDPAETTINTGNVGSLQQIWSATGLGGAVGEPMIASNVTVNGQAVDVIYFGSMSGTFYAYNADTGAQLWAAPLGSTLQTCSGHTSRFGTLAAAAIDRSTNRIYVGDGALQVHALDLGTGAESSGWPITIATQPPNHNFIYGGLTYNPANHMVYAGTSATCDNSPWYGRVVEIDTALATIDNTFYPMQGKSGGGIWGFGGASIDPQTNDVFIATGNADVTKGQAQNSGYAEQLVALTSDLSPLQKNLPPLPGKGNDYDFGATPLLFQPPGCPPLLAAVNKSGVIVVYDRYDLAAGTITNMQISISSTAGDLIGVPSYDPQTNLLYVGLPSTFGSYHPGMAAFSISSNCGLNPTPQWTEQFGEDGATTSTDTPRSPITIANGVVYISDMKTSTTYAFDASTGAQLWTAPLSGFGIVGPVLANGKLYVGSMGSTSMTAWALPAEPQVGRRRPRR